MWFLATQVGLLEVVFPAELNLSAPRLEDYVDVHLP